MLFICEIICSIYNYTFVDNLHSKLSEVFADYLFWSLELFYIKFDLYSANNSTVHSYWIILDIGADFNYFLLFYF